MRKINELKNRTYNVKAQYDFDISKAAAEKVQAPLEQKVNDLVASTNEANKFIIGALTSLRPKPSQKPVEIAPTVEQSTGNGFLYIVGVLLIGLIIWKGKLIK